MGKHSEKGEHKTVGGRQGKQCHLCMDLRGSKGSLIKMIIPDRRQRRKGDYKTLRSEKSCWVTFPGYRNIPNIQKTANRRSIPIYQDISIFFLTSDGEFFYTLNTCRF